LAVRPPQHLAKLHVRLGQARRSKRLQDLRGLVSPAQLEERLAQAKLAVRAPLEPQGAADLQRAAERRDRGLEAALLEQKLALGGERVGVRAGGLSVDEPPEALLYGAQRGHAP